MYYSIYTYYSIYNLLVIPNTQFLHWGNFCVGTNMHVDPKSATFGHVADVLPTCCRHSQLRSLVESKWCDYVMVEADGYLKLLPPSILNIYKCLSTLIRCPWAYSSSLKQLYPTYLAQILGFWVTCGVKMMSLRHGWGWQPPQTASHIRIRHIRSVWAHWLHAVHWHMVAALHSYTHPTCLRFWGSGSLVESKWCHYVMVEANSHLKLLLPSILDINKVFEHIDILSIGIW